MFIFSGYITLKAKSICILQTFANLVMVDVLGHEDYNFEPNPALPLVLISVDSTDLQQATHDKTALSGQVLWVRTSGKT